MPRGKGVKLQSYREGGLRDGVLFDAAEGAGWIDGSGRRRAWPEWREWLGTARLGRTPGAARLRRQSPILARLRSLGRVCRA